MPLLRLIFAQLGDFRRSFHCKTVPLDLGWTSAVGIVMLLCTSATYPQTSRANGVAAPNDPRVLAYYVAWQRDYRADDIPYNQLTHINHAFLLPQADGSLWVPKGSPAYVEPRLIEQAHKAGVQVLAAIGGYGGSEHFSTIARDPRLRAAFADNIAAFLRENEYDGVDIDWEFPQNATDRANQTLLIKAIRDKFAASPQPGPNWLISMAVAASNWSGQWNDYAALNELVDFYNLMTYDFHGSWSEHAGHNAPLYRGRDPDAELNVAAALDYMLDTRAVPAAKLNVGIPFYGRNFTSAAALYDHCLEDCVTVDAAYHEIAPLIGKGWAYHWDAASRVPYLTHDSGTGVFTYDNPLSVKLKVAYAQSRGAAGVFMWDVSADAIPGGGQPLLNAMYTAATKRR